MAFWGERRVRLTESALQVYRLEPPTHNKPPLPTQVQISSAACGSLEDECKGLVEVQRRHSVHAVTKSNVHSVMGQLQVNTIPPTEQS